MVCPKCGSYQIGVIDSRTVGDNIIRRRRKCSSCDYRYNTVEISQEDYNTLLKYKCPLVEIGTTK